MNINQRQHSIINCLFDGFKGKLTSSKWAKREKCSQDTASRDIQMLIDYGVLQKDLLVVGARVTRSIIGGPPGK
ncbi:MAG: hypothetical protein K8F91_10710 [Candidatus Obscuribacterales bacterium]|nr:hypothetical protein [Candidatus Obscuribacterales bacterium]